MKKTNQILSLLLAGILLFCTSFTAVAESEIDVIPTELQETIANLPDFKELTDPSPEQFFPMWEAYEAAYSEIVKYSDEAIFAMENHQKLFDGVCYFFTTDLIKELPTEAATDENIDKYLLVLSDPRFNYATDYLYAFSAYTSPAENPYVPEESYSFAEECADELANEMMGVSIRLMAYLSLLSEEELGMFMADTVKMEIDRLDHVQKPEQVLSVLPELLSLLSMDESLDDGTGQPLVDVWTYVDEATMARYQELMALLEQAKSTMKEQFLAEIDAHIASVWADVDFETTTKAIYPIWIREDYFDLSEQIMAMDMLFYPDNYEESVTDDLVNYYLLETFEEYLYDYGDADIEYGDVNYDGLVDAIDALEVLKFAVGKLETDDVDFEWIADVSGDGIVDAIDALNILQYAVGKLDIFPVEVL
jgi:hypothetical protein